MNATTASATTAQTTNAPRVSIGIWCYGRHKSNVMKHDITTAKKYFRTKARQGYVINRVVTWRESEYPDTVFMNIDLVPRGDYVIRTPGYQQSVVGDKFAMHYRYEYGSLFGYFTEYPTLTASIQYDTPIGPEQTPVKYGVRSIKDGVVLEWETFATIEDARGYAEDDIEEGATESVIIAVNRDGSLGDVVETIRPEPVHDEPTTTLNAIEECAKYCPTAQDAVKVAMLLNPSIRVVSNRSIAEIVVDENEIHARTRPNNQYVKGWCDLGVVSIELHNEGLLIWYVDEFDNATRDYFIPWIAVQTVTVLNTGRDIFKSVKGAN